MLENDVIAKIVVIYFNLELFSGQNVNAGDSKVLATGIGKVSDVLTIIPPE